MGGVGFDAPGLHDAQYPAHFSEHCGNDLYFEGRDGVTSYRTIIYVNGINYSYQSFLNNATPREIYKTGSGIEAIAKNYTVNPAPAVFKVNCSTISGVEENVSKQILFDLYPNPSNGEITINLADYNIGNCKLTVNNLLGELLYSSTISGQSTNLKLDLKKGLYFISLYNNGQTTSRKIIVE